MTVLLTFFLGESEFHIKNFITYHYIALISIGANINSKIDENSIDRLFCEMNKSRS